MCYYGDFPDASWSEMRRSRRDRRCDECGRTIRRGEQYESVFAVEGRDHWSVSTCRHCVSAREWLVIVCRSWQYGALAEELIEHASEYPWVTPRWLRTAINCMSRRWTKADGSLMNPMGRPKIPDEMRGVA